MTLRYLTCLLFFVCLGLAWNGCKNKSEDPQDPENPDYLAEADCTGVDANTNTYTNTIKPFLDNTCGFGGCHNTASANNGVILDTYAGARKAFEEQVGLCAIHWGNGCAHMPDGGPQLPANVIQMIDCWAKNGYKQ